MKYYNKLNIYKKENKFKLKKFKELKISFIENKSLKWKTTLTNNKYEIITLKSITKENIMKSIFWAFNNINDYYQTHPSTRWIMSPDIKDLISNIAQSPIKDMLLGINIETNSAVGNDILLVYVSKIYWDETIFCINLDDTNDEGN